MDCYVLDLGLIGYQKAWDLQQKLVELRSQDKIRDTLILCQHPPVITLGKRDEGNSLLLPRDEYKKRGIEIFEVDRGGHATYHGPGQMVGYIIRELPLSLNKEADQFRVSWTTHRSKIVEVMKSLVAGYGIEGFKPDDDLGVWVNDGRDRKIGSVGVLFRRLNRKTITIHGFALNVNNDLTPFDYIVPCDHKEPKIMTSLKEQLGKEINYEELKAEAMRGFTSVFGYKSFEQITLEQLLDR